MWTWDDRMHPQVARVLEETPDGLNWCNRLEHAPADATVGKVLCVCVATAIAREVLAAELGPSDSIHGAARPLDLVGRWVDCPTDERFEGICAHLFGGDPDQIDPDPHGVVWWALRTATSSVGNYEAGWALEAVRDSATSAGFSGEALHEIAKRELLSRLRRP